MTLILAVSLFVSLATALWPIPISYSHGDTVLSITEDVKWYWSGASDVGSLTFQSSHSSTSQKRLHRRYDPSNKQWWTPTNQENPENESEYKEGVTGDEIVDYAIKRAHKTIFKNSFIPWKFHPRGWQDPDLFRSKSIQSITLSLLHPDPPNISKPLAGQVDESYTLTLPENGCACITANTSIGLARGLTTFTQLFYAHSSGGSYTPLAPVHIYDAPKFAHRGINLDVARQYFPVRDIKRTISAAAYNKMNVLHLHITDSQAWPLEIPSLPNLTKGAYQPDQIYTAADFKEIQRHAAIQGVQLITEIDMPGHTASIFHSYPDLIAAFDVQPNWQHYAAEPPSGTLKLNSSLVDDFLESLLDDLLPRIEPYAAYFHTGGDEVNRNAYELDETVRSKDIEVLRPLMQRFMDRNHERVRARGLTPVVWEEMLVEWNITLGKDVVVQSWRSDAAVAEIVARGHKALVGNYQYWYLDCGKGQWLDFAPEVADQYYPFNDYCSPFHNWRLAYSYDPLSNIPAEHHHLILGGETHLWTEQTSPLTLDPTLWPRASAVAEVLWSGAKDASGKNRSQIDASPRLSDMRERLVALGVGAEVVQMPYCSMEGVVCQMGYRG